jgi:hypothetical protein
VTERRGDDRHLVVKRVIPGVGRSRVVARLPKPCPPYC